MRLRALLAGTGIAAPEQDVEITGISYDTRTLRPGELFVALRGSGDDGHKYLAQARSKGAAALVAEEGGGVLLTSDSRAALAAVSANWFGRPGEALTLAGITGTNGKTTSTTLLAHILRAVTGERVGLIGTNQILVGQDAFPARRTTPESYELHRWLRRMADAGCKYAVMEVSSHALSQRRTQGLRFRAGGFTNLTRDHLDFHGTMEAYRQCKGRLFSQSETAVLNADDEAGLYYAAAAPCQTLTYSQTGRAELLAERIRLLPHGAAFRVRFGESEADTQVPIPGGFSVSNALCALGCALALGLPLRECADALHSAPCPRGRMEYVPTPGPGTVIIDYAHTPDALEKVLTALRPFTKGRLLCLFGCGGDRDRTKRPMMGSAAVRLSDVCVVTSDNPRSEDPMEIIRDILEGMRGASALLVEPDREKAVALALDRLAPGDTLLLAGKGHETWQEVRGEKRPMDEREIVANFYHL